MNQPGKAIMWATVAYGLASLVHFIHNATYLDAYPNLPESFTPASVMISWLPIGGLGGIGYLMHRRGRIGLGRAFLAVFAVTGYAGFLHYTLAPVSHHSVAMNITILLEAITGTALLATVVLGQRTRPV